MRPLLVCLATAALLTPSPAHAGDGKPYQLQVVLLVAKHRHLTDVLQDKLERELGDGLQAALGGMARVEVVRKHELQARIAEVGLQRAVEGWGKRSDVKTHFLLLDFGDETYRLQSLQHDGTTGQAGPQVRVGRTRDRDFIFRLAADAIEKDFGLLGTVADNPAGGQVTLHLDGGPGTAWSRWVKPGEVFALVRVRDAAGPTEPIDSAYLQVLTPPKDDDRTGACVCKVAHRYTLPDLAGCRAVKLATTAGATIRLRLVDRQEGNVFQPLREEMYLYLRQHGFDVGDGRRVKTKEDRIDTATLEPRGEGVFDHLVFVTVAGSDLKAIAQVPVPLLGQPEVVVPVSPGQPEDNAVGVARSTWVRGVSDAFLVQADLMARAQKLAGKAERRDETRKLVDRALARADDDVARLKRERVALVALAEKANRVAELRLEPIDQHLKKVEDGQKELRDFLAKLDDIDQRENDPKLREGFAQVERARLLKRQGEYDQALAIYDKLLADGFAAEGLQAERDELAKLWEPKGEEHRAARTVIFDDWPKLDTAGVQARMADVRQALAEVKKADDKLTARRLLDSAAVHAIRVRKEMDDFKPTGRPEDQARVELLNAVAADLAALGKDLRAYLGVKE